MLTGDVTPQVNALVGKIDQAICELWRDQNLGATLIILNRNDFWLLGFSPSFSVANYNDELRPTFRGLRVIFSPAVKAPIVAYTT
jgi:hypothetical protein